MKIAILDTETFGGTNKGTTKKIFDMGYIIVDMQADGTFKVLKTRSYATEHIDNELALINDTYCGVDKYNKYKELLADGSIIKHSTEYILNKMVKDLDGIDMVFAYNCAFDKGVITTTALDSECANPLDGKQVKDIWAYACQFICNTNEYKEWADGNGRYTESGVGYSQKAESVYQYISGDDGFVEAHMALADSRIELEILAECVKRGAKLDGKYKLIRSLDNGKVNTDNIVLPDGQELSVEYTKKQLVDGKIVYVNKRLGKA